MWFELFHVSNGWLKCEFCTDLLFNDKYLLKVLAVALPHEFEYTEELEPDTTTTTSLQKQQLQLLKEEQNHELKLFSSLKGFFKARELDLTEVLKSIRTKKLASRLLDYETQEKAWWQLLHIVFTAFYIDHSKNAFLESYFQVQLRSDLKQMKMVLDIISSVLKRTKTVTDGPTARCSQPTPITPTITIIEQKATSASPFDLAASQQDTYYQVQVSDFSYLKKLSDPYINNSSDLPIEDEDDDEILKEDISDWDVFDDFHKFQLREQKLKEKHRKQAQQEKKQIEKERIEEIELESSKNLEQELEQLESKIKTQEETIRKKNDREEALMNELNTYQNKMKMKQLEIEQLNQKMVFYETFKHKFDVKKVETERLLTRVEELSQLNGGLEDQIERQKGKSGRLQHDIDDLKDKIMLLKNSNSGPSLAAEKALSKVDQFKQPRDVKIMIQGHCRFESSSSVQSAASNSSNNSQRAKSKFTLQHELFGNDNGSPDIVQVKTRPTLEDEEIFDGQATFRSQYRFETTEDDLVAPNDSSLMIKSSFNSQTLVDEELPPALVATNQDEETMDGSQLKQEFVKEQTEKKRYRSLYFELDERCNHYQSMMEEYERLYSEFLTKCIKAEKERVEMQLQLRRLNWLQACALNSMNFMGTCKAKLRKRKQTQKGVVAFGCIMAAIFVAMLLLLLF